ncbi:hypothetical protein EAF00_001027 [Botryotinia globosa]|nr:hypothetical protein EAF00_001027 [Botryotinia globosa]
MEADMFIEHRLRRAFLAEAAYLLKTIDEGQDQTEIANTALETVTRIMDNWSITPKEIFEEMKILSATLKVLKIARENIKAFDESTREFCGDQVDFISPRVLWEKFNVATDLDSAKAAWMEHARDLAVASRNRERYMGALVDEIIESLEHLGLKD